MLSFLTIMGLYEYDSTIFDNLVIPDGIVREDLINSICLDTDELEVIYPSVASMKLAIGIWSKKELPVWNKMYATTKLEYNPLWNTDRTEENTTTETRNLRSTGDQIRDLTSGSNGSSSSTNSGSDTTTTNVSGFNGSGDTEKDRVVNSLGSSNTGTSENNVRDTGSITNDATDTGTIETVLRNRTYGSIGVMTSQVMIKLEREVDEFNIIEYIVNSFKQRFCIGVY